MYQDVAKIGDAKINELVKGRPQDREVIISAGRQVREVLVEMFRKGKLPCGQS